MSTAEVEPYQEHGTAITLAADPSSELITWAAEAQAAYGIAAKLVTTSFVPSAMRQKPHEATAAILTGQEVGLKPMAALRSINIISGTPAMTAIAMRGLVQSRGHKVWVEEQTDTRAVVCGQRRGSDKVQKSVWTMDRAHKLGLTGKDNWKKQPQAMLVARATAEVCRLIAADVLLGLPYAVEELEDVQPVATGGDEPAKPARRTAKRRPVERVETPAPELEPAPEPTPEAEAAPVEDAEPDEDPAIWPEVAIPGGDDE